MSKILEDMRRAVGAQHELLERGNRMPSRVEITKALGVVMDAIHVAEANGAIDKRDFDKMLGMLSTLNKMTKAIPNSAWGK